MKKFVIYIAYVTPGVIRDLIKIQNDWFNSFDIFGKKQTNAVSLYNFKINKNI